MREKKLKVRYTREDEPGRFVEKKERMTESEFESLKEMDKVRILSVDGKPAE